nr:hypothetical protein [Actinomycetota bacterium]
AWTGQMGMGPLAWGTVEFALEEGDRPRVTLTHESFGGFDASGVGGYSYGWDDLLQRLAAHLVDNVDYGVSGRNTEPDGFSHTAGT